MASETQTYIVKRGRHNRNESGERRTYSVGDEIELTEAAAARMGDAVELTRTSTSGKKSTSGTKVAATDAVAGARAPAPIEGQTATAETVGAEAVRVSRTGAAPEASYDFSFMDDQTVSDVTDHVSTVEDVDELRAMKRYEKKNKDRVGVVRAIDERLAELK